MNARVGLVVLALGVSGGWAWAVEPAGGDEDEGPPKNLKVLPPQTTRTEVNVLMKTFTKALGVKCKFCHNPEDFASDEKKHKVQARHFMRMTQDLEKNYFAYEGAPKVRFNCYVCHRGSEEPTMNPK